MAQFQQLLWCKSAIDVSYLCLTRKSVEKVDLTVDSLHIFHPGHACLLRNGSASPSPKKTSFQITYTLLIMQITKNPALKQEIARVTTFVETGVVNLKKSLISYCSF